MYQRLGLIIYSTLLYVAIGAYWVTLSWTILEINPNQDAVGRVLIIGSLCTLLTAPMLGIIVDRVGFRKMTVIGQGFSLVAGLIPLMIFIFKFQLTSFCIYGMSLLVAISSILCIASFDRALKFAIPQTSLKKTRTLIAVFQQIAMMFGTAMSGLMISQYSEFSVFLIISILAIISAIIFLFSIKNVECETFNIEKVHQNHFTSFVCGVQHIVHNRNLLIASLCIAIAYASAQVINVSLPAFIKLELNHGSNLFGFCEACWALGGILSAMLLTTLINKFNLSWLPLASLTTLGICMMGFASLINPTYIIFACLIMGALFSSSRTLADANLLSICNSEMIGRVRSNTMAITSLIGIAIYLIPILVKNILPSALYFVVGLVTVIISIYLFSHYQKKVIPGSHLALRESSITNTYITPPTKTDPPNY